MNYKNLEITPAKIRWTTLIIGLLIAAFLMARNLPSSSSPEFWTELTTGTGIQFVLYGIPYVLFAILLRKARASQSLTIGAVVILVLGIAIIAMTAAPKGPVRPENVSMFDPSVALVALQIMVTAGLARVRKAER